MGERLECGLLISILVAFVVLSTAYSVLVPPFEASDELWHYPMVKHIADNWSLPVQDPANVGPWRQEGSQPPLYYVLGAVCTFWIDTSDMEEVRHLNPHADSGMATPDGNVNLVVHRPEREAFPWRGTVLAVHVVRFLSIALATVGVALTYFIVREIFPGSSGLALGATALHAFTPMVVFIAGSVNNDNLVVPVSSLALLMLLRLVRPGTTETETSIQQLGLQYLPLGIILGLAALTKASSLALTLLTALVVVVRAVRRRSRGSREACQEFFVGGLASLLPVLAIAGWWYMRNLRLYGDLTGLNVFIEILGQREVPASLAQLWRERYSFLAGYWGNFGGLNVPMPSWVYRTLNTCLVVAAIGLVGIFANSLLETVKAPTTDGEPASAATGGGILSVDRSDPAGRNRGPRNALQTAICLLWGLGVLIPWIQWARVTWSSQGRLLFAALPTWSLLLTLGLGAWLPRRLWVGSRISAPPPVALLALFLLGLSAAAPFAWIKPAYALPGQLSDAEVRRIPHQTHTEFGGTMKLLGYELEETAKAPGEEIEVTLFWEALAPTEEDHVVFVHLLDQHELVVAQRDTLPGLGLLSTTWLDPGYRWADRYLIPVPATAYRPNRAEIQVGLFNSQTDQRLTVVNEAGAPIGDNVRFGQVSVRAEPGDGANPVNINFGGRMILSGYDLSERAVQAGETVTLTLRWEALEAMNENYTVSAQLIDRSQRKAAQHDGWPQDGAAPTGTWQRGEAIDDTIPLTIFPDAEPGPYRLRIAVYVHEEAELRHLPVTPAGGQMQTSAIELTGVRVLP